jgi:hypothetical protein
MTGKHVVVDGSNIATEGRSLPSLRQLDEAVRAFLTERPHELCTVVVDATFEHRIDKSEKQLYDEALAANELLTPPAGSIGRGDKFILEIAERSGATVFSNDSFQEFHGEYEWLFEPGRLVGGKPVPGVGWVMIERNPVRGAKSRMATRAASKKGRAGPLVVPMGSGVELGPMPVPTSPPPGRTPRMASAEDETGRVGATARRAGRGAQRSTPVEAAAPAALGRRRGGRRAENAGSVDDSAPDIGVSGRGGRRGGAVPVEPLNAPLPFIEFVAEYQTGAVVTGLVTEFSSHGATVEVNGVRCYAPLRYLGDPPPRAAREVLVRGESHEFVVAAIHAARRGIDLGLPGVVAVKVAELITRNRPARLSRRAASETASGPPSGDRSGADQAPGDPGAEQPESEVTLAPTKKAPVTKVPAKKATAKKAPAAKAVATKARVAKAPARKLPVAKAPAKKVPAKKVLATKAPAVKVTAKKAPAAKAPVKKAPAKKASAAKATVKRAPVKKAPAKKVLATKAPARKAPAAKAAASKAVAKKAPATRAR